MLGKPIIVLQKQGYLGLQRQLPRNIQAEISLWVSGIVYIIKWLPAEACCCFSYQRLALPGECCCSWFHCIRYDCQAWSRLWEKDIGGNSTGSVMHLHSHLFATHNKIQLLPNINFFHWLSQINVIPHMLFFFITQVSWLLFVSLWDIMVACLSLSFLYFLVASCNQKM